MLRKSKPEIALFTISYQIEKSKNIKKAVLDYIAGIPDKIKGKLKSNDCLILALCKRFNSDLVSFDKGLLKVFYAFNLRYIFVQKICSKE